MLIRLCPFDSLQRAGFPPENKHSNPKLPVNKSQESVARQGMRRRAATKIIVASVGSACLLAALLLATVFNTPRRIRRLEFFLRNVNDRGAIVFAGDSIIAQWGDLRASFPGMRVTNRGLGGDSTVHLDRRLRTDVLFSRPSAVVLLIGTNDLNGGERPDVVVTRLLTILQRLRENSLHLPIVVCKLTPRERIAGKFPERIKEFNSRIEESLRDDPDTIVFDSWSLFADPAGTVSTELFPDGLHPGSKAYARWATALKPILEELSAGVPPIKIKPRSEGLT